MNDDYDGDDDGLAASDDDDDEEMWCPNNPRNA